MQEKSALDRAMAMVRDLRIRCSWDRAQDRESLRPYLIEEAHELDQAIGSGDPELIRREVSDLLLHLAWQLVLAEDAGEFTADDAARDLEAKMRRRHPHLFDLGPKEAWEKLKGREKTSDGSVLDGLPPTLPALLMAHRLQDRAAALGFDWPDVGGPIAKIREELGELEAALAQPAADRAAVEHELGDLLFSVVNLARKADIPPSAALERANQRFRERFRAVEQRASQGGVDLHGATVDQLDRLWNEVKDAARSG
jgi:MazG family protein